MNGIRETLPPEAHRELSEILAARTAFDVVVVSGVVRELRERMPSLQVSDERLLEAVGVMATTRGLTVHFDVTGRPGGG